MQTSENERKFGLGAFLDYFIPMELQVQADTHRRARMFMLSHVCGPFLGNVIPIYLYFINGIETDFRFWTFLCSVTAFWIYPFALRYTKKYKTLAFISIANLNFCIFWACFSYGGIYSPFLPWVLVIPVLSFLYLPATGLTRSVILTQIVGSVGLFGWLVVSGFEFPPVNLEEFQIIGIISTVSASIYVTMMAIYFANFFRDQLAFERELGDLRTASDNLRNLTQAAKQATAAKADFVASMSHELRTPLNAVIGYSQLLLDDAADEGDAEAARDIGHIHSAGAHLLRLVDDILDFSKIEAGKMPVQPSVEDSTNALNRIVAEARQLAKERGYALESEIDGGATSLLLDWQALGRSVIHLVSAVTPGGDSDVQLRAMASADRGVVIVVTDPAVREGSVGSDSIFDVFSDVSDTSSTKYGGAGISLALALKFAQLIGGVIEVGSNRDGRRVFTLKAPVSDASPVELTLAA